jgi:hypothetical protein
MSVFLSRRSAAKLVFIIGLLLMLLGSAFLFGSLSGISRVSVFISFFFVIAGIICAVCALKLNKQSVYLFCAALFLQTGLFLFLAALKIIPGTFSKSWPLLSVFTGLALIPTGWRYYGEFRIKYMVPAGAFIVLGAGLLVFSLNLVAFPLTQFVARWWPLLIVLAGLILILFSLATKHSGETKQ